MSRTVFLDSFAAITARGLISPAGTLPWDSGQKGPAEVKRSQVLSRPYPNFGKLTLPDRLAFGVASLMLSRCQGLDTDTCGICIGIPLGSLAVDLGYCASLRQGFPSPALFSATLPSSPVSEIAIFYKIKGPDRVIADTGSPGISAFDIGHRMIVLGKATAMIVLLLNGLEHVDRRSLFLPAGSLAEPSAFAFLLAGSPRPGGLGLRCTFRCLPQENPLAETTDGHYFSMIVETLGKSNGPGSITLPFSTRALSGELALTKD